MPVTLPSKENQEDIILGDHDRGTESAHALTPDEARQDRLKERQLLAEDSSARTVEWSAEMFCSAIRRLTSDDDADGEMDPDFGSGAIPAPKDQILPTKSASCALSTLFAPEVKPETAGRMVSLFASQRATSFLSLHRSMKLCSIKYLDP